MGESGDSHRSSQFAKLVLLSLRSRTRLRKSSGGHRNCGSVYLVMWKSPTSNQRVLLRSALRHSFVAAVLEINEASVADRRVKDGGRVGMPAAAIFDSQTCEPPNDGPIAARNCGSPARPGVASSLKTSVSDLSVREFRSSAIA